MEESSDKHWELWQCDRNNKEWFMVGSPVDTYFEVQDRASEIVRNLCGDAALNASNHDRVELPAQLEARNSKTGETVSLYSYR